MLVDAALAGHVQGRQRHNGRHPACPTQTNTRVYSAAQDQNLLDLVRRPSEGLQELSKLGRVPAQTLARTSPGARAALARGSAGSQEVRT